MSFTLAVTVSVIPWYTLVYLKYLAFQEALALPQRVKYPVLLVFPMVSLSFFGGVGEIGGNKILLEDKGTRIFLDFGAPFGYGEDFFVSWLKPRPIAGLKDHFEFGLMPEIPGLYAEDELEETGLDYCSPRFSGVFLSHAHYDHMAHIQFLDPKIPIFCGAGTEFFIKSQEATAPSAKFGEHEYRTFRTGDKIKVGPMTVIPVHVDHSIPAAYGFIIQTSAGNIVYTGDLRMHGPRSDMTVEFLELARKSKPVALISEGTRMAQVEKRKNYSEEQVRQLCSTAVKSSDKLVLLTSYSRDIDRLKTFHGLCKETGRCLVIPPSTAYLLKQLQEDKHLEVPDPLSDSCVRVYFKRKKGGEYLEKEYFKWEREFLPRMITADEIRANPSGFLLYLTLYQFGELIDIRPEPGTPYIHSMSEPFSDEDIEDAVKQNWIKHFQLDFHQIHASGHASRPELEEIVRMINAKKVFPVHTEHPELFEELGNTVQIEKGKEYRI